MIQQLTADQGPSFSLWLFSCCSKFCVSNGKGFLSFYFFSSFLVSFLLALWTELAHQEVRKVSEMTQGKSSCSVPMAVSVVTPFTARAQPWRWNNVLCFFFDVPFSKVDLNMSICEGAALEGVIIWWSMVCNQGVRNCSAVISACVLSGELLRWIFWVSGNLGEVIWKKWDVLTSLTWRSENSRTRLKEQWSLSCRINGSPVPLGFQSLSDSLFSDSETS